MEGNSMSDFTDIFDLHSCDCEGTGKALEVLKATMALLLPFIPPEMVDPLYAVLRIAAELKDLGENPSSTTFAKHAPHIVENISIALCVPKHNVRGILALAQGDWEGAADLCRPFCNLDPDLLHQICALLPSIRKTVDMGRDKFTSMEELGEEVQLNSHFAS